MGQETACNNNSTDIVSSLLWRGWYSYLNKENSNKFNKAAQIWGKKMLETNVFSNTTCFLPRDLYGMCIFK